MAPMLPDGDPTGQAGPLRSQREAADPRSPATWAGTRDGSNTTVTCATNGAADEDHCIQDVHICPDPSAGSQFGLLAQSPCARSSGGKSLVSNAAQVSWSPTAAGAHADEGRAAPHNCALGWAINSALAADSAAMPSRDLAGVHPDVLHPDLLVGVALETAHDDVCDRTSSALAPPVATAMRMTWSGHSTPEAQGPPSLTGDCAAAAFVEAGLLSPDDPVEAQQVLARRASVDSDASSALVAPMDEECPGAVAKLPVASTPPLAQAESRACTGSAAVLVREGIDATQPDLECAIQACPARHAKRKAAGRLPAKRAMRTRSCLDTAAPGSPSETVYFALNAAGHLCEQPASTQRSPLLQDTIHSHATIASTHHERASHESRSTTLRDSHELEHDVGPGVCQADGAAASTQPVEAVAANICYFPDKSSHPLLNNEIQGGSDVASSPHPQVMLPLPIGTVCMPPPADALQNLPSDEVVVAMALTGLATGPASWIIDTELPVASGLPSHAAPLMPEALCANVVFAAVSTSDPGFSPGSTDSAGLSPTARNVESSHMVAHATVGNADASSPLPCAQPMPTSPLEASKSITEPAALTLPAKDAACATSNTDPCPEAYGSKRPAATMAQPVLAPKKAKSTVSKPGQPTKAASKSARAARTPAKIALSPASTIDSPFTRFQRFTEPPKRPGTDAILLHMPGVGPPNATALTPSALPMSWEAVLLRRAIALHPVNLASLSGAASHRCVQQEGCAAKGCAAKLPRTPRAPVNECAPPKTTGAQEGEAARQPAPVAGLVHGSSVSTTQPLGVLCMAKLAENGAEALAVSQPDDVEAGDIKTTRANAQVQLVSGPPGHQRITPQPFLVSAPRRHTGLIGSSASCSLNRGVGSLRSRPLYRAQAVMLRCLLAHTRLLIIRAPPCRWLRRLRPSKQGPRCPSHQATSQAPPPRAWPIQRNAAVLRQGLLGVV